MSLVRQLRDFDQKRIALLDQIEAMDPARLAARPSADKWSILEIVEHLVIAERLVYQDLPDPARLVERPRKPRHRFRYLLVAFFLKSGIPVRVPSPAMVPRGDRRLGELRRMWDENQQWLQAYVAGLDAKGRRKAVFRHPVAGPLLPAQVIRLNRIHFDRHARQILRMREDRDPEHL